MHLLLAAAPRVSLSLETDERVHCLVTLDDHSYTLTEELLCSSMPIPWCGCKYTMWYHNQSTHGTGEVQADTLVEGSGQCVPKKRSPFEVKRWCCMLEFKCFNSLIALECMESYSREFLCMHTWSRSNFKIAKKFTIASCMNYCCLNNLINKANACKSLKMSKL